MQQEACNNSLEKYESTTVKVNCVTIKTTWKSNVKGYDEAWFDEWAITKFLALKNVNRRFRVTYDSNNDEVFTFHKPNGKWINFNINKGIIHYRYTKNWHFNLVQTVRKNEECCRKIQLKNAKLAR